MHHFVNSKENNMKTRKHLKISSIVVLVMAAMSLLNLVSELAFGELNNVQGADGSMVLITKIVLLAVSLVLLFPQIYVGLKGLKMAKNPDSSKGHIVWATIILAIAILNLIDPILGFLNKQDITVTLGALFSVLLEIAIYFDYIKYAKAVAKETDNE